MRPLLIRADASVKDGTGHVMRQLAVAQWWGAHHGPVTLLTATSIPALIVRLVSQGILVERLRAVPGSVADAEETRALALTLGASWVVADGYRFDAAWQISVTQGGPRLALFDDNGHGYPYSAHLVVNQNAHASERLHPGCAPHTRLFLGCSYVQLRDEFAECVPRPVGAARALEHALITVGGSDPHGVTCRLMQAADAILPDHTRLSVVVGAASPHLPAVAALAKQSQRTTVHHDVQNMALMLASVDLAISAAGTTMWELCYLGVPTLLVTVADNQLAAADTVTKLGAAWLLGSASSVTNVQIREALAAISKDALAREALAAGGRALVDGHGRARLANAILRWKGN